MFGIINACFHNAHSPSSLVLGCFFAQVKGGNRKFMGKVFYLRPRYMSKVILRVITQTLRIEIGPLRHLVLTF